jgi:hypothetical protein
MINQVQQIPLMLLENGKDNNASQPQTNALTFENSAAKKISSQQPEDGGHSLEIKPGIPNNYYFDAVARTY